MFKARYLTRSEVDGFYKEALTRYERIVLQARLNAIAVRVSEDLPDAVRAAMIMGRIEADWGEPDGDEP